MRVEREGGREGRVGEDLYEAVAVGEVEVRAGPVEDALVCLDGLVVGHEWFEGGAIDGDDDIVLLSD